MRTVEFTNSLNRISNFQLPAPLLKPPTEESLSDVLDEIPCQLLPQSWKFDSEHLTSSQ